MKIEILGMGCPKCKKLADNVEIALKELGIEAEIAKVTKINDIMNYGVMVTPALVVDGEVKVSGRVPDKEGIKKFLCSPGECDCGGKCG